jgi:hypothetical protein
LTFPAVLSGPASQQAGGQGTSQFGLTAAMALIVGSIIGVGIFNLPTSLAFYGPITLVFSILFIWYSRNTGHSFWVYWAPFFLAAGALVLGIPVYLAQRRHMSQPGPVPPYR